MVERKFQKDLGRQKPLAFCLLNIMAISAHVASIIVFVQNNKVQRFLLYTICIILVYYENDV